MCAFFTQKKNRPRPIDLDILTYDDIIYSDDTITLPHPRIEERNFVLVPLNEIASNHIISSKKLTVKKILNYSKDISKVCKL